MAYVFERSAALPYAVWTPPNPQTADGLPVVVFLHGSAERGTDAIAPTTVGIGPDLTAHPERWRCVVVMPQCPDGETWSGPWIEAAAGLLDVAARFGGDTTRLAITGISMGGAGAWRMAAETAGSAPRLMPVCGWADREAVPAIAALPIWIHHGADDPVVPSRESREMTELLAAAGADVRYDEHAGWGHDVWDTVYPDPATPRWLVGE